VQGRSVACASEKRVQEPFRREKLGSAAQRHIKRAVVEQDPEISRRNSSDEARLAGNDI
jgi:hypothetical protein